MYEGSENIRNLNNKQNLNPSVEEIKAEIEGRQLPPTPSPAPVDNQKRQRIEEWNNNPDTRKKGIKAIDIDKEMSISKKKWRLIILISIIGMIALGAIAIAVGMYGYIAWQDGTLLNDPVDVICGNTTLTVEPTECPTFECADVVCGSCNVPDTLEIILTDETV